MEKRRGWITRIFRPDLQGGVAWGVFQADREQEMLDQFSPGRELGRMDRTDRFSGNRFSNGRIISLDNADAFQGGTSDFENGREITGMDDVLPCDLVGRRRDKKVGRSGKRTWDR